MFESGDTTRLAWLYVWAPTCVRTYIAVAVIEEEKKAVEKESKEMLANLEKHKELERQQQEKVRKVCAMHTHKF